MTGPSALEQSEATASGSAPASADRLGLLLDLALEASTATGAALLVPDGESFSVLVTRGANAPAGDARLPLNGSLAGEAWYRARLMTGPELSPRGRQGSLWSEERLVDVMAAPVLVESRPVAVFVLYHGQPGHFRRSDATTLGRLAEVVAGLWSVASVPATKQAEDPRSMLELRVAAQLVAGAAIVGKDDGVWQEIARAAGELFSGASVRVSALDGAELVCRAAIGRFAGDLGRRRSETFGFEGMSLETPAGILIRDWTPEPGAAASSWIGSLLSIPLRRMAEVLGVLTVAHEAKDRLAEADRLALQRLALHAAAALVVARLGRDARRHATETRLATRAAAAFANAQDTEALRRLIVTELRDALEADGVRLIERVQHRLTVTAEDGDLLFLQPGLDAGGRLGCGHPESPEPVHSCTPADDRGHFLAAELGQLTQLPGRLELVRRARAFDAEDQSLLRRLAESAEVALLSRTAHLRLSQHAERIRSVAQVSASLHQALGAEEAMGQAADILYRTLGLEWVAVALVDEFTQEVVFPVHRSSAGARDGVRYPLGRGLVDRVRQTRRTVVVSKPDPAELRRLGLPATGPIRSLVGVPLALRGGPSGVVLVGDSRVEPAFEAEDLRLLEIMAQQLGVTLDNLASFEEERHQRITAEWLRQMARAATEPDALPEQILEIAADAAFQGLGGVGAIVSALPGDGTQHVLAVRGAISTRDGTEWWSADGAVAGWIVDEHGAVFVSANLAHDPRLSIDGRAWIGPCALAAVPVWSENRIVGVLALARATGAPFAVSEVERLAQIADHAGVGFQTAQAGQALRQSEERYRRLLSVATDAIVTLDPYGTITSFNAAAERLWQVPERRARGRPWSSVLTFEDESEVRVFIRRALAGASVTFEEHVRRADGERGFVAATISPLVEAGQTVAVLVIVRDVSEQRQVQAQLLQAEKMSAMGLLVGGMAHEVNNPLASILAHLELLLGDARDSATLDALLAVKAETDRAAQIVRNLLTYVRGQGSERALVDLRDPVSGALALRRNQLQNQQIELAVVLPPTPLMVRGNRINLQQVLMNLLVNSEHALRQAGRPGHVWIRVAAEEGNAVITVDDDGPGIAPELTSRIFDPFFTTKPEGEGTGLGLSVSAGIIADHQGRISASDRPGGGARFEIELPLATTQVAPAPEVPQPPSTSIPARPNRRVLVVDDEPELRRSIARLLTRSRWQVDVADSGEEGLQYLAKSSYDAVLCDLRMPGMSGPEFFRRLEAEASPAVGQLVFMTGDVVSPEAQRFLGEAARPVLAKPFGLHELLEVLGQVAASGEPSQPGEREG